MTHERAGLFLTLTLLAASGCSSTSPALAQHDQRRNDFEAYPLLETPSGFTADLTADGGPVQWAIVQDPTAPAGAKVLAQLSAETARRRYPICIFNGFIATDVECSVRFKAVSGTVDQAAGIVIRCTDKNNYYVVRANALENNVRLYRVVDGVRTQFAGVDDIPTSADQWHSLSVKVHGTHFTVAMNDVTLFEADDATFNQPGRIGLWTKADSVTYFDDLRFRGQ